MNRIALTAAALSLAAAPAFAATAASSVSASPQPMSAQHHAQNARYLRDTKSGDRMTKALNLLEAKGYTDFTNFRPDGSDYSATIAKNGHDETVRVDPDSGQVTAQS